MPPYPPSVADVRTRVAGVKYLAALDDASLQGAIDAARGEIEIEAPAVGDGVVSDRVSRAAWALSVDLAVWHVRMQKERDEEGGIPKALTQARVVLDARIKRLAQGVQLSTGTQAMESFDALPDPALPGISTYDTNQMQGGVTLSTDWSTDRGGA